MYLCPILDDSYAHTHTHKTLVEFTTRYLNTGRFNMMTSVGGVLDAGAYQPASWKDVTLLVQVSFFMNKINVIVFSRMLHL